MTVISQFRAEKKPLGAVFRSERSWATALRGHEPHSNARTLAQHLAKHTRGAASTSDRWDGARARRWCRSRDEDRGPCTTEASCCGWEGASASPPPPVQMALFFLNSQAIVLRRSPGGENHIPLKQHRCQAQDRRTTNLRPLADPTLQKRLRNKIYTLLQAIIKARRKAVPSFYKS